MRKTILLAGLAVWFGAGAVWARDEVHKQALAVFKPIPSKPPALTDTRGNRAMLDLGRKLFFDPRLSSSQLISCNTCHNLGLGGVDLQETSIGHGWQKGPRNAPTVLNAVFNLAQFWDGRAEDLEAQAKGPVQAGVEMNNKPERVIETLKSIPGYVELFKKAYPRQAEPLTFDNMAKAIELFEATLVTPDAPFDRYLKGEQKALSSKEVAGLRLFLGKGCAACHGGINVGGTGYFTFGVVETPPSDVRPPDDTGRYKVTSTADDKYKFKSPSLRNIALTRPYFHSGKVWSLRDAVQIMGSAQLGMKLSDDETNSIVLFLHTLRGTQPRVECPTLPAGTDGTPRPMIQ